MFSLRCEAAMLSASLPQLIDAAASAAAAEAAAATAIVIFSEVGNPNLRLSPYCAESSYDAPQVETAELAEEEEEIMANRAIAPTSSSGNAASVGGAGANSTTGVVL